MADKSRFRLELSEAEIDASLEELWILDNIIILLGLAGYMYKIVVTYSALGASLVIYHFISSTQ